MLTKYILVLTLFTNISCAYNLPQLLLNRRAALTIITHSPLLLANPDTKPICIIGASGATGRECVKTLALQHQPVRAVSRTPVTFPDEDLDTDSKRYIEHHNIDIKDQSKIGNIVKGTSAVIFLANAKKYQRYADTSATLQPPSSEQTYEDIDVLSLKSIATACITHKVPRLVYVSASCRSCESDNEIDKMSGIQCDNCRTKQAGEKIIRRLYKEQTSIDYTIIRIGFIIHTGTYEGERRGPKELELNQDFTKSGMISKYDLSDICINAAQSKDTASTTFETYYRDTAQPYDITEGLKKCTSRGKSMEECFFGSAYKSEKPRDLEELRNSPLQGSVFSTGFEYIGETYPELFKNLKRDY